MNRLLAAYARFLVDRRWLVVVVSAALTAASLVLALRLPIQTDIAVLLPPDERSVQDLLAIQARARGAGTLMVLVRAPDRQAREAAAAKLAPALLALPADLVSEVIEGDGAARRYFWDNRFLFASLTDLTTARDALVRRIDQAKLAANPAYVSFEDDAPDAAAVAAEDDLRKRLADAEKRAMAPSELVSRDGRTQLWVLRTARANTALGNNERLVGLVNARLAEVSRAVPGLEVGLAGDVIDAVIEQKAVLGGMMKATVVTVLLVGLGLLAYFRSLWATTALLLTLTTGVLATFGFTWLVIGRLNSVSAFLAAIVIGVGIDFGIILLARYIEERRHGRRGEAAIVATLAGSIPGTLTAALVTGVAYASLIITDFRGFREFGIIGGVGMLLCWLFTLFTLPALLSILERRLRIVESEPGIGRLLGRLIRNRRLPAIAVVATGITLVAGVIAWGYLASGPFEYNWRNLRATSAEARAAKGWMDVIDREFGRDVSGAFVIAAARREDVGEIVRRLRALDAGVPPEQRQFGAVASLEDLVPADQPAKLALLGEIRELLADDALAALDAGERAELDRLRPPSSLRPLGDADVPAALANLFAERDGTRGRLIFVNYGGGVDNWDGRALAAFSDEMRGLELPQGTLLGGAAFVFTDIMRAVERDGTRASWVALAGVTLFVLLVVGWTRHAAATLIATLVGMTCMIAGAALLGLKVNFLDFVALPLVLGIGVDYAANVALRDRQDAGDAGPDQAPVAIATTGGAVALCSYTTIVGYGSLILSDNAGIRSFGLAATMGEIACLLAALTVVPAVLHLWSRRQGLRSATRAA